MKFEITKEWLNEKRACEDGFKWFCRQKETDCATVMRKLVKVDRENDALWLFKKIAQKEHSVKLAIFSAELVLENYEKRYPENKAPRKAIEAAKAYLKTPCEETRSAAYSAAWAADSAAYSADSAAWAAYSAADLAASSAARAACSAAYSAADSAASSAARAACSADYKKTLSLIVEEAIKILELEG